jgi:hypothetical protein
VTFSPGAPAEPPSSGVAKRARCSSLLVLLSVSSYDRGDRTFGSQSITVSFKKDRSFSGSKVRSGRSPFLVSSGHGISRYTFERARPPRRPPTTFTNPRSSSSLRAIWARRDAMPARQAMVATDGLTSSPLPERCANKATSTRYAAALSSLAWSKTESGIMANRPFAARALSAASLYSLWVMAPRNKRLYSVPRNTDGAPETSEARDKVADGRQ